MKIVLIIFFSVLLLLLGLSFLSPSSFEEDENSSDSLAKKVSYEGAAEQYKRRDFIKERRMSKHKILKGHRNDKQNATSSRHDDFMVYTNDNSSKTRYDDFR